VVELIEDKETQTVEFPKLYQVLCLIATEDEALQQASEFTADSGSAKSSFLKEMLSNIVKNGDMMTLVVLEKGIERLLKPEMTAS